MWQLWMHCNLRQPHAEQSLSTLIRHPWQPWSRSAYPLTSYSVLLLIHHVTLWSWTLTRDLDLWHWTCTVDILRHSQTLYKFWAKSDNPWRSYCSLNIWPYDREHVSRAPLCCGIVCTKFKLSQAIRSWNVPWPLTCWPWKSVVDLVSRRYSL